MSVDPDELSMPYHRSMIASLKHCKGGMDCAMSRPMKICVLGLGGGLLTKFLYDNFKKVRLFDAQNGKIVKFDTVLIIKYANFKHQIIPMVPKICIFISAVSD